MANVIDVVARLRAENSDYMRKMKESRQEAEKFQTTSKNAGNGMASAFGFGTKAVSAMGAAMVAAGGAIGGVGFSIAMANETSLISFTQMLGSAEKAGAYMKELADFAAVTPFEFPELRGAASRLLVVGTAAEDVIPLMTALGDATAAMGTGGEGITRATRALQQMQTKGKITGEEMMQLSEAGIPGWITLAAAIGKTVPETQKLAEKGELSVQQLMDAIQNYSGPALGRVKGMMEQQAGTLTGMLSTLKDTITMQLGDFMTPVVKAVKDQLPAFTDAVGGALTAIAPQIQSMMTSLLPAIQGLMPALQPLIMAFANLFTNVLTGGVPLLSTLGAVMIGIQPALIAMGDLVGALMLAFAPLVQELAVYFVEGLSLLTPILEYFTTALGNSEGVIQVLIPIVAGLTAGFVAYKIAVMASNAVTKAQAFFKMVSGVVAATVALFAQKGATDLATGSQIALNGAMAMNPIGAVIAIIVALVAIVIVMYKKFDWFREFFIKIWNGIVTFFNDVINKVLDIYEFFINGFIKGVNILIKGFNKLNNLWGGTDIKPLKEVNFELNLMGALIDNATTKVANLSQGIEEMRHAGGKSSRMRIVAPTVNPDLLPTFSGGVGAAGGAVAGLTEEEKRLQTLIDKVKELKNEMLTYKKGLKDAFTVGLDADPNNGSALMQTRKTLKEIREFKGNIKRLQARGVGPDIMAEVAGAGLYGGNSLAKDILKMSDLDFREFTAGQKEIRQLAGQTANIIGTDVFGKKIQTAENNVLIAEIDWSQFGDWLNSQPKATAQDITINMPAGSNGDDVVKALQNYNRRKGAVPVLVNGDRLT